MIEEKYKQVFGIAPDQIVHTPGRVNLIGEHTDYNGGMVLPTALKIGISIALTPRNDSQIRVVSNQFDTMINLDLSSLKQGGWSDYALGSVIFAKNSGLLTAGADLLIHSTIPRGAGLSSSAALIVGILKAARNSVDMKWSDQDIALLAQQVENEFIGMPCGIMDQMAVAIASYDQALALDTKSLRYTLIDLPKDFHMAVIHSGKYRDMAEGHYKERKEECDVIKKIVKTKNICLMSDEQMMIASGLPHPLNRRARHCRTEHLRTVAAADALKVGDIQHFGILMNESHVSMRDDFEISLPEIDVLVDDAVKYGAIGARLTGGGFGGCIVACIRKDKFSIWKEDLLSRHREAFLVC